MVRHIDPKFGWYDAVLFLVLWWPPSRRYGALTDIVGWCDWLDRSYPTAEELDGGLNRLLAAGLIQQSRDRFYVPAKVWRQYNEFRRRRRRNRFVMAREFVESAGPLATVPRRITIRHPDLQKAIEEFHRRFQAALKKWAPSLAEE
jgi:hypothetical protein